MMEFPYGLSDFGTLIREGYFYQDRTDRIAQLEKAGRQLIFIRPRRFGKSLGSMRSPVEATRCSGVALEAQVWNAEQVLTRVEC